jgi:hypothetical protein
VEGRFKSGYTSIFNAYSHFDTLSYDGMTIVNTDAELNASKIADSTAVLAMATVVSEKQEISPQLMTKNLLLEAIWNKSQITMCDFREMLTSFPTAPASPWIHQKSVCLHVTGSLPAVIT